MITGTRVKVTGGIHHGKRGLISSVRMTGEGEHMRVIPTVILTDNSLVEISGKDLTPVR